MVDLKLGHFRQLSIPGEVTESESDRGKEMCAGIGMFACSRCRVSVMHGGVVATVCCVGCVKGVGEKERAQFLQFAQF